MASLRYEMNFGDANAGGSPTFKFFVRQDTGAAVTPPTIHEAVYGNGSYYFDWDWSVSPATTISWKAELAGIEQFDVISSPALATLGATVAGAAASSLAGYSTAKTIINRAAIQCNLAAVADPFASTDANFVQFIELLNTLGDDLNNKYDWTQFVRECTIITANSATSYALPVDFHEMFDQSGWNRSMRLPLVGPLSAQEAQFLKARLGSVIINVAFRIEGNLIVFPIAPADNQTIAFEYISNAWVQTAASGTGPDASSVNLSTDTVLYDPDLMVSGLKLAWLENHGFDTQKAEERFQSKLAHCIGKNYGARVLSMGGSGLSSDRFLDQNNVPPTNFG